MNGPMDAGDPPSYRVATEADAVVRKANRD
jgi:hypothetical protein